MEINNIKLYFDNKLNKIRCEHIDEFISNFEGFAQDELDEYFLSNKIEDKEFCDILFKAKEDICNSIEVILISAIEKEIEKKLNI